MTMEFTKEAVQYIIYPLVVLAVSGIVALAVRYIIKYFNRLNLTLTELNKSIQLLILDQTRIHAEQDKDITILRDGLDLEKTIRKEHRVQIDELYDITSKHTIELEVLKQVKEDK